MENDLYNMLRAGMRDVPDFPKAGILFRDITPVLADAKLFRLAVKALAEGCVGKNIQKIAGVDARGFIFGAAVAYELGLGFVPVRKRGKLPFQTVVSSYQLEYGAAEVEMHTDAIQPGERVSLIDDLLATGGTANAAIKLIQQLKGEVVQVQFLVEIEFLHGREVLAPVPVVSILRY
ncbi:MAG: adenine phosphoribosyltransferase [Chthoniobacterales bacterium]